jgi:hypothetical protein
MMLIVYPDGLERTEILSGGVAQALLFLPIDGKLVREILVLVRDLLCETGQSMADATPIR